MRATHHVDAAGPGNTLTPPEQRHGDDDVRSGRLLGPELVDMPEEVRLSARNWLNRVLADYHVLSALSRKHHRIVRSAAPHLSELFAKHAEDQYALVDELADRVHRVGGVAAADPRHIAELTRLPRSPEGAESVRSMVARQLQGHDIALRRARAGARVLRERGDHSTAELLESRVAGVSEEQLRELIDRSGDPAVL